GDGTLSAEQADAVRREVDSWRPPTEPPPTEPPPTEPPAAAPAPRPWTMLLAEVGGYGGGAFVLGAGIVLAGQTWAELTTAARVAVLLVPAVLLVLAAVGIAMQGRDERGDDASTPVDGVRERLVA